MWKLIHSNWGKILQHDFILNTATTVLSVKPHVIWPTKQGWGQGVYRSSPLWRKQREESEEVEGRVRSVYRHCCDWSPGSSMTVLSARWRKNEDTIQVKLVKYFIVFLFLAKAYLLAFLPQFYLFIFCENKTMKSHDVPFYGLGVNVGKKNQLKESPKTALLLIHSHSISSGAGITYSKIPSQDISHLPLAGVPIRQHKQHHDQSFTAAEFPLEPTLGARQNIIQSPIIEIGKDEKSGKNWIHHSF